MFREVTHNLSFVKNLISVVGDDSFPGIIACSIEQKWQIKGTHLFYEKITVKKTKNKCENKNKWKWPTSHTHPLCSKWKLFTTHFWKLNTICSLCWFERIKLCFNKFAVSSKCKFYKVLGDMAGTVHFSFWKGIIWRNLWRIFYYFLLLV